MATTSSSTIPPTRGRELGRFRVPASDRRSPPVPCRLSARADRDGRASDVIALQVVTVGAASPSGSTRCRRAGDYAEAYYLHGFSVQAAEALAEHTHRRIRSELGFDVGRGKRYSWGYGACPDLSQHELVWRLLDVGRRLGAELTEAFQIVPEQSTAAIVIHHPQATYFNAAAIRESVA